MKNLQLNHVLIPLGFIIGRAIAIKNWEILAMSIFSCLWIIVYSLIYRRNCERCIIGKLKTQEKINER